MKRILVLALLTPLWVLGVRSAVGETQSKIRIDNSIPECARLDADDARSQKNLVLLPVHIEVVKSIGGCGCKSGAIRYRVYETYQGRRREMNRGLLNSLPRMTKSDDVLLVLNSDNLIHRRPPFFVDIACAE